MVPSPARALAEHKIPKLSVGFQTLRALVNYQNAAGRDRRGFLRPKACRYSLPVLLGTFLIRGVGVVSWSRRFAKPIAPICSGLPPPGFGSVGKVHSCGARV